MDEPWQLARRRKAKRAQELRQAATDAEQHLWRALRLGWPDRRFRRQHPIGLYFADFVCLSERLIIEVDGGQHSQENDAERTRFLEGRGFRILRFWNNDVLKETEGVMTRIADALADRN